RMRKKFGLQPVDDIVYYFKITEDPEGILATVLQTQAEYLRSTLKQELLDMASKQAEAFAEEEQEVNDSKFALAFVRA
ncbi:isoleucine--tRNA ligase, partial [Coemansia sp. RSA 2703]